ncbi:MAG: response regulator transcription factor [Acidobacteria bacterium]|nr:response regulator transcription factor [Acidobacteriota bacterium]
MTTVLIADDHKIFRDGLRSLLQGKPDFEILGEASDGRTAVNLTKELHPDVVIMDVIMPQMNGIEAMQQIAADSPDVKVLALSMYSDKRLVMRMLDAGASGYLLKDCAFEELTVAIDTVTSDQIYLSPRMTELLSGGSAPGGPGLTVRETEVLKLVSEGRTTRQIGDQLRISVKTVETHRKHIMDKLGLHSIASLTKFAVREGLTTIDA